MALNERDDRSPWRDLAAQWQDVSQQWSQWWMRPVNASAASPTEADPPVGADMQGVPVGHAEDVAALNARYESRFRALWLAAQQALLHPQHGGALPVVAEPAAGDRRFTASEWSALPYFALMKQQYLLTAEYMQGLAALSPLPAPEKRRVTFMTRQLVDAMAPTNFAATNPEVWKAALASEGQSLLRGYENLLTDVRRGRISMTDEAAFELGRNLAVTPGDVIHRNDLIELIQYRPSTAKVHKRPLLIVPPCINKYYILDLQPQNSFVRWAVGEGHTVFMISWRNIPESLGHLTWDDYVDQGVLEALDVVRRITRCDAANVLGFCVGGAILACALAVLAARGERRVASASFLTTLLDYADPGEIGVYISHRLLEAREPSLLSGQRVHGGELATAFASLRANELVWNYVVNNYLKGTTPPAFDLLYWNSDSCNLPGPMYAYYLRNMYLDNQLCEPDALTVLGESIDLGSIDVPAYVYASRDDHIVPWKAAYRTVALLGGDVQFALGASGHIAGVVNPPAAKRRHHWINRRLADAPDAWLDAADQQPGSWWPHWGGWLQEHGGGLRGAPRKPGNARHQPLEPAPGSYVRAKVE
ncbi:MAG: class I poly(R)-hydroxyalkanoic acid synthase [Casimicrobiaceae bacterium]